MPRKFYLRILPKQFVFLPEEFFHGTRFLSCIKKTILIARKNGGKKHSCG